MYNNIPYYYNGSLVNTVYVHEEMLYVTISFLFVLILPLGQALFTSSRIKNIFLWKWWTCAPCFYGECLHACVCSDNYQTFFLKCIDFFAIKKIEKHESRMLIMTRVMVHDQKNKWKKEKRKQNFFCSFALITTRGRCNDAPIHYLS